jgi:hypothetical protein
MENYIFAGYAMDMAETDVSKLLDPRGPQLQKAARGTPNEARVAVAVHWGQINLALDAGYTTTAIYRVLSEAGLVSISLRSFHRQVLARREAERMSWAAVKPAAEPRPSTAAPAGEAPITEGAAPAVPVRSEVTEKRPGIPDRPWRRGPREAPDPNFVFKPRDPLAEV